MTLVISPLIALMNDQVNQLKKRGIRATAIHGAMRREEVIRQLDAAQFGKLKLLYISPERLKQPMFQSRLQSLPLSLLVVDEAHCISLWGYDFRPAYLDIAEVRKIFPEVSVIALTASATAPVIDDIADKLNLNVPKIFRSDFIRPNLRFGVIGVEDKKQRSISLLKSMGGSAIIYVRSRRQAREVAQLLVDHRLSAAYYHAGLSRDERLQREEAFYENRCQIMVATNAFGMGIDKSDIRCVLHLDIPESLEAYYQEAGRAGRDGKDAYAIILYHQGDTTKLSRNFDKSFPPLQEIKRVYRALGNYFKLALGAGEGRSFPFEFKEFAKRYQFDPFRTWHTLKLLEQGGWITLSEAYYQPTRIGIMVDKATLYAYQIRNPHRDPVIKTLLRLYQGILQDMVAVREKQLATLLQMDRSTLRQHFRELASEGIIKYQLQDDKPRLTMLRERVAYNNLTIDENLFTFRKERRRHALEKMLDYLSTDLCRQRYILEYFDDPIKLTCGICDNCRQRTRKQVNTKSFREVRSSIIESLSTEAQSMNQLLNQFPAAESTTVLRVLQYLLNEEKIFKSDEMISLN